MFDTCPKSPDGKHTQFGPHCGYCGEKVRPAGPLTRCDQLAHDAYTKKGYEFCPQCGKDPKA